MHKAYISLPQQSELVMFGKRKREQKVQMAFCFAGGGCSFLTYKCPPILLDLACFLNDLNCFINSYY